MVEAIKDKKKIEALLMYLRGKNTRDWLLCKAQLNTGLRISDVVDIKVSDIMHKSLQFRDYFKTKEQKTHKSQTIKLNDSLKKALKDYIITNKLLYDNYIFKSEKTNTDGSERCISTTQAYRILKDAADSVGIENFGTHSLRKTWGYWTYKASKYNIALIMDMYNHSNPKITLGYIGITQEQKDELYSIVQF